MFYVPESVPLPPALQLTPAQLPDQSKAARLGEILTRRSIITSAISQLAQGTLPHDFDTKKFGENFSASIDLVT
jgi:hypothetical protein